MNNVPEFNTLNLWPMDKDNKINNITILEPEFPIPGILLKFDAFATGLNEKIFTN